jgi:hypothetical protein
VQPGCADLVRAPVDPHRDGEFLLGGNSSGPHDVDAQAVFAHAVDGVGLGRVVWTCGAVLRGWPRAVPCRVQRLRDPEAVLAARVLGVGDSEEDVLSELREVDAGVCAVQDGDEGAIAAGGRAVRRCRPASEEAEIPEP